MLHYRQLHISRVLRTEVNCVGRLDIVAVLSFKDIGHILLRVTINHREPGALYLDHDAMSLSKSVVDFMKIDDKLLRFVWGQW